MRQSWQPIAVWENANALVFQCFPCNVCPEPVLVKSMITFKMQWLQKDAVFYLECISWTEDTPALTFARAELVPRTKPTPRTPPSQV